MTYEKKISTGRARGTRQYSALSIKGGASKDKTLSRIMDRFGVSRRQAYRYIEEALSIKQTVPVPERKVVFTVKVPKAWYLSSGTLRMLLENH